MRIGFCVRVGSATFSPDEGFSDSVLHSLSNGSSLSPSHFKYTHAHTLSWMHICVYSRTIYTPPQLMSILHFFFFATDKVVLWLVELPSNGSNCFTGWFACGFLKKDFCVFNMMVYNFCSLQYDFLLCILHFSPLPCILYMGDDLVDKFRWWRRNIYRLSRKSIWKVWSETVFVVLFFFYFEKKTKSVYLILYVSYFSYSRKMRHKWLIPAYLPIPCICQFVHFYISTSDCLY